MNKKFFLIIALFIIAVFDVKGQDIKDIFEFGDPKETTLTVDSEIAAKKIAEEQEKVKQDSIKQINLKLEKYFIEQNNSIQEIINSIELIDTTSITKESIDNYELMVSSLKKEVETRLSVTNKETWEDKLFKMESSFFFRCDSASLRLKYMKEKLEVKKNNFNLLIILGACLVVFMLVYPKIKQKLMTSKTKKEQRKIEKKKAEVQEKLRLLSDEDNIITLKD